jgi:hypothetical protein
MALFVYRFRLKTPVLETQLEVEVGVSVSVDDYAGGAVIDIECDDASAQDLIDAMDARGYEFVEGSPATTSDEEFRAHNSILGPVEHRVQDQLVHEVAEDSYEEYTYVANKITSIVVWTDGTKTKKIREELYTYTGLNPTQIITKQYDADGVLEETLTENLTYAGVTLQSISRSLV